MSAIVAVVIEERAAADAIRLAQARQLAQQLALPLVGPAEVGTGLVLVVTAARLELRLLAADAPGPVYVDFVGGAMGHRRKFGGGRGQLIAKAVGVKKGVIPAVVDATAGLGRDAFVLANLGCRVTMLERSPVVGALLHDGLERASSDGEAADVIERLSLQIGDARQVLAAGRQGVLADVVYLDPMFPQRDKSALVKKEMRLFKALLGSDPDAPALLEAALKAARKRVVVKRPRKAAPVDGPEPGLVFEGKSTRFDVYLCPKS